MTLRKNLENHMNVKYKVHLYVIIILFAVVLAEVCFSDNSSYATWIQEDDKIKYLQEDGQYAVGFLEIEEIKYYFDSDGDLVTGKFYVEEEDAYYYADTTGAVQYGVIRTEDDFFMTDEEGRLLTGFAEYDGKRYFFNEVGEAVVGWFKNEDHWYYADHSGVIMTGFITVDGYRYYLNADGTRVSDAVLESEGITYIINKDGTIDENATTLYPVFQSMNQIRVKHQCPELLLNNKVQACAILRASELTEGFAVESMDKLEQLLANRGISCDYGYEFSYGGIENYDINRLIQDIQKDRNILTVLTEHDISEVGLGMHVENNISYYDIIFIAKTNEKEDK